MDLQTFVPKVENIARAAALLTYRSKRLNSVYSSVKRSSDLERIKKLRTDVSPFFQQNKFSAAKYADFSSWLLRNLYRAAQLDLHKSSQLRILDLGAGPGYFVAATRALGHDCRGIDVPARFFTPLEQQVYDELLGALNCRPYVTPLCIERFVPLPFPDAQFDLITAFLICFNQHTKPDQWGVPEWRFFVADALRLMRAGGRLFLGLNENPERYGDLLFYDSELLAFFESVGSVDGARVKITKPA